METLMPPAELETGSGLVTVSGVASQACRDASTFARSSLDNLSAADNLAHPSSSCPFLNAGTLSPYSMPGVIYSPGKLSPTPSCRSMGRSPSPMMQPDTSTKLKTLTPFVLRNRREEPRSSGVDERLSASVDELTAAAASLAAGGSRRSPLGRIREGVPAEDATDPAASKEKTITTDNSVELNRKLDGLQEAAKIGAPATTQATKTTPSLLLHGGEQGNETVPAAAPSLPPPEEERRSSRERIQVVVDDSRTRPRPTIFSDIRERVFGSQQTTQQDPLGAVGGRRQPPPWPEKKPVSVSRQNEEVAKTTDAAGRRITEKPELDPKSDEFSSSWQDSGADDDVVWKRREEADDGVVWKKQQSEDLGKSYAAKVTQPVKVTDHQDAQKQAGLNQSLEPPVVKTQEETEHTVESSPKPVESLPKPVESSPKQVESPPKQVESPPKQMESSSKQMESLSKPVESSPKPVEGTAEKVASEPPVESPSTPVAIETSSVVLRPPVIIEPVGDGKDQTGLDVKTTPVQTPVPAGQQVAAEQGTEKPVEKAVLVAEPGGQQHEDKEPENTDNADNQTKMLSTEQRDKMNLERRRQLMDRMAAKRAQTLKGLQKKMEDAIDIASHFKPFDMGTVFTRADKQTTASADSDSRQPTVNASRPTAIPQGTLILYQQGEPKELLKRADSAEALARQSHAQRSSREGAFLAESIAAQNAAVALAKSQPTLPQISNLEARGLTKALTVKEPQAGARGGGGISPSQLFTSTTTSARKQDRDPGAVPPKTQPAVKTGVTPQTMGQSVVKSGAPPLAAIRPVATTAAVPTAVTQPVIKIGAVPPAISKPATQPVVKPGTMTPTVTQPVVKTGTVPPVTQPVVKTGTVSHATQPVVKTGTVPPVTQPVVKTGTVPTPVTQPVVKTGTVPPVTQPVVKTGTVPPVTQPVVKTGIVPPVTQPVVKTGTIPPVTQPVVKTGTVPPPVTQPVVKTGTVAPSVTQPDVKAPAVSPSVAQPISRTGVVLPARVQPGVKPESLPLAVTRSETKPSTALLISPKSRVDWAKQKFASSDVLDPNFGLSVEPVSSKTPAQQQETESPATAIPVAKEVSLQARQGSEMSEDFRRIPENRSAPAIEPSSATSYIELTQIAEITPLVAPPVARQIVQQPSVKPPVSAPDFPAMGQQAPSLQTTVKSPDTSQSPALQITQQSVMAKPPAAAQPGPALQITQQSVVKPPVVVNQVQPVTTPSAVAPHVQVISQQVATKSQPPVSPHLQITQTSTIRAAEPPQQQTTTQTPFGLSFTRPEPPPPQQQQQQPASIAPTAARQPAPSTTMVRSSQIDYPGAQQTTQRPPNGIQISTSSKQVLPPSVIMETRQTDADTRPVRDPAPGAVDPRVRGQGTRPTPAQEEPRAVPIIMRVPSVTDRTESVVCNPIVYAYVSDPEVQEIRMSVREEVKPAIVLEPDVPESRLVTVLHAGSGSGSGLRGSAPVQETRTTQISNELYKQTSTLGRPGEASNVSNAGQTRTRVFDPPLVPEVPLSPAAIWSNTTITLNQQFPPAPEDATTRDRPLPRTTTTTATSHVGGYSSQGQRQGQGQEQGQGEAVQTKVTIQSPAVRFQPPAETQHARSAEAVQPPDRIARQHHQHHTTPGSRDMKDEDTIIRAPAHGSGSDPGQTRLVSSLQLQPKTEPAPIVAPVVQAASHRIPAPDQRDRKLPDDPARYSIPISVESSAKKMAVPVQVRHHVTQDQPPKQPPLTPADPQHRQVTPAAVDAGKQQQQLTVKDEQKSGPPSPRPGGGTEGDKGHQLGTNLSRVMEVLAKKETEAKKPVKKGLDSMGKSLDGSGTIRKQLIQMESALHPSSAYRSETVPPRRSPRLLRKPKPLLSKSQTIDVSGLKAERELEIFLKTRKEVSSSEDEDISRSRSPRRTSTETRDVDFGNCDLKTVSVLDRIKVMETKVGKTFFSALRAKATAFRAAQTASEDQQQQRSEEERRVDRLANFARISDVSVGQRRRQFMTTKRHQTTKARSNSLPRTYDEFVQAENHPGVERLRTDVLSRHPWSYPLRCLHRQPRPAPRRRSVRRRSLPVHLDRLPPETLGSPPRPLAGHGPLRPPSNRLLAAPAISVISEEGVESPPAQAQAYPLPPLPPGFREATRGPAAASSGHGRLRIEMPPSPAIDVSGIVPGSELSTPSTPLSAIIGGQQGGPGGGGGRLGQLRRRSADMMDSDDEFDKMVEINIKELGGVGVGAGVGVGSGVGRVGGTPDSKAQPLHRQPPPTQQQQHQISVHHTHPMQQQQQVATQQRQHQQPPQQQQSGQLRQTDHQAPSSSSSASLPASQQPHRPQQQQQQPAPDLAEVQSPTDSFTLQPIASRVKEWDAAIAEEKSAARAAQQLLLLQESKADAEHLGIKRAAPETRSPRLSTTDNRKSVGSEFLTEGAVQEGPEGQSEDELSKLSLADKLKFFSALTTTQPPEPPPPTSKRGKGKRAQTRHQTQYADQQPVTSEEVEQAVSSRQRQHPYQQQQQQQQYEHQQYQPQQQYQQQYYQQQQYQPPQYQQQQQYLQQYQQPPYQDQQYFQQYQQPLYQQQQQYQQHMYQQQQTYNPVASRHIYRDY